MSDSDSENLPISQAFEGSDEESFDNQMDEEELDSSQNDSLDNV